MSQTGVTNLSELQLTESEVRWLESICRRISNEYDDHEARDILAKIGALRDAMVKA